MIVGLGVLAGPVGALAQEAQKPDDSGKIEEIVVTAEKRSENLRDVPASISALSGATLEQQGGELYFAFDGREHKQRPAVVVG